MNLDETAGDEKAQKDAMTTSELRVKLAEAQVNEYVYMCV